MQIRLANIDDAETISLLNEDVQRIHAIALPHVFKPPSKDTFPSATIMELLSNPNHYFYIAELDGEDIGYIYAETRSWPETPFRYAMEMVYIHHISIRPKYQQRGFGESLLEEIKKLAHQKNISYIALDVWSFNVKAHAFFAKQGFSNFNERMWMEINR